MNKEEAIHKINTVGKVGQIIIIILMVIVIICLAVCLAATVLMAFIPKDFIKITPADGTTVDIDLSTIGYTIPEEKQERLLNAFENGSLTFTYSSGDMDTYSATAEDISIDGSHIHIAAHTDDTDIEILSLHNIIWIFASGSLYCIMTLITLFFAGNLCTAFRRCHSPFEPAITQKMTRLAFSLIPWAVLSSIAESIANMALQPEKFEFQLTIDLGMVFIILLLFGLVFIFKYGAVLQQESDETL